MHLRNLSEAKIYFFTQFKEKGSVAIFLSDKVSNASQISNQRCKKTNNPVESRRHCSAGHTTVVSSGNGAFDGHIRQIQDLSYLNEGKCMYKFPS